MLQPHNPVSMGFFGLFGVWVAWFEGVEARLGWRAFFYYVWNADYVAVFIFAKEDVAEFCLVFYDEGVVWC